MPVGIKHQRALNPILQQVDRVISEAVAFANPTAQYVAEASVIAEGIASASGMLLLTSSSEVIGEAICDDVFSNQQSSSSSVIAEAIGEVGLGCGPCTGTSSGGIDIYDEGVLVKANATHIDIVGEDARVDEDGDGAIIWHPPPSYVSNWNTTDGETDASVADISVTSRIVSTPSGGEGSPFFANGWSEESHDTIRGEAVTWSSAEECSFINQATTFEVTILDGDSPQGTLEALTTIPITGNGVYSSTNIIITVSNWATDTDRFKANVSIEVNIGDLLPNGGYFDASLVHHNGASGDFTKEQ